MSSVANEAQLAVARRARQMQLVNDVALRLSSILAVEELLWEVVRLIQSTFGYYYVNIYTVEDARSTIVCRAAWDITGPRRDLIGWELRIRDQGMGGWVAWSGEPLLAADVARESRYYFDPRFPSTRSEVTVPIKRGGRTIGLIDAQDVKANGFDADDVALLETLARQISVALENAALFEELTRSRAALEQKARDLDDFVEREARAQEEERRRIAADLHDGVMQLLIGSRFELETIRAARPALAPAVLEQLGNVTNVLGECCEEMRRAIFDLYPPGLEDLGLLPALQRHVSIFRRLSGLGCALRTTGRPVRLSPQAELAAYRIVQEALSNVFKHAGGADPTVELRFSRGGLRIVVRDSGPGFEPDRLDRSRLCFGLENMRRKATSIGATLDIRSGEGRGTTVTLAIPQSAGTSGGPLRE